MKSLIFFVVLLFFSGFLLFGETIIRDGEKVYGTWTKSNSPYIIEGEAIVPNNYTLIIKPGVEVKFKTGKNFDYVDEDGNLNELFDVAFLRVQGRIIAKGGQNEKILFTHNESHGFWGVIVCENTAEIVFENCVFEYSHFIRGVTVEDNATGAISFINTTGNVFNCLFINNWVGLNCKQGSVCNVSQCVFTSNEYAIESNSSSKIKVLNSIIWSNSKSFYRNAEASIIVDYSLIENAQDIFSKSSNIIGKNPKLNADFSIDKNSPCYKKGKKGKNIGLL